MFARTERLLLRPSWPDDAPAIAAARCCPPSTCAPAFHHRCVEAARATLDRPLPRHRPQLLIVRRGDAAAELIGGIALVDQDGATRLDGWVRADCRNRGYATEAGHALIAIAAMLGIPHIDAPDPADGPTAAVFHKLGFRPVEAATLRRTLGPHANPIDRLAA